MPTSMPSFILVHPTVWPQYTNIRQHRRDRTDSRLIAYRANRFTNGRPKLDALRYISVAESLGIYTVSSTTSVCSPPRNVPISVKWLKIRAMAPLKVIQGHRFLYQSKAHIRFLWVIITNLPPIVHPHTEQSYMKHILKSYMLPYIFTYMTVYGHNI